MDDKHQERSEDGHSAEYSRPQHHPDPEGTTPMTHLAEDRGNLEIIKFLALFCNNFNTGNEFETTIGCAASRGNIDIVKFLAPLCDNPNALGNGRFPKSPIEMAKHYGHTDVVNYLTKLMEIRNSI